MCHKEEGQADSRIGSKSAGAGKQEAVNEDADMNGNKTVLALSQKREKTGKHGW